MSLRRFLAVMLVSTVALCAPSLVFAQGRDGVEKVEVFGGYSWYRAGGNLPAAVVDDTRIPGGPVPDLNEGWGGQFTYNLNHWAGIAVDGSGHYNSDFGNAHTVAIGPQFRLRKAHFTLFGEALLGAEFIDPKILPKQNSASFIGGGGIDYRVNSRLSIRPIQADYVNSYYQPAGMAINTFNGIRLQAGLVVNFGLPKALGKVGADCVAEPEAVDAGAPVRVSLIADGFSPKRKLSYSYASNGGKVSATATAATVDTTGLAPGSYMVTAKVADDGKGKQQQRAQCQASFKVNELPKHAPTLSVSARPASVVAGETSTITANGSSADNRPLSFNCTTTAGRLTGSGPTYTLETAGVFDSTVEVSCTVSDDRDLTASASTSVRVNAKVMALAPVAKKYASVEFQRDSRRPTRVDNEAKGELDRYADALAAAPDSKGVVVGYATAKENTAPKGSIKVPDFAAQRAVNTKDYITKEKGVDPARIEPRTADGSGQKVELWIIPAGAVFHEAGTTVVDQAKVKAVPRIALKKRAAHRRKATE